MTDDEVMRKWRSWMIEEDLMRPGVPHASSVKKNFRLHWEAFARNCGTSMERITWATQSADNLDHPERAEIQSTISDLKSQFRAVLSKPARLRECRPVEVGTASGCSGEPKKPKKKQRLGALINKAGKGHAKSPRQASGKKMAHNVRRTSGRSEIKQRALRGGLTNDLLPNKRARPLTGEERQSLSRIWDRIEKWLHEFERLAAQDGPDKFFAILREHVEGVTNARRPKRSWVGFPIDGADYDDHLIERVARLLIKDARLSRSFTPIEGVSIYLVGRGDTKKHYGSWSSFRHGSR